MGLDISYYSHISLKCDIKNDDNDYDYAIRTNNNNNFNYQLGSLKKDKYYYTTPSSKYGSFRAGSYSGYNYWRNELAILIGYDNDENVWKDNSFDPIKIYNNRKDKLKSINGEKIELVKPFLELIFFSDCEGVIGPDVSKKLYDDFCNYENIAKLHPDKNFYDLYLKWKEAFKVASDNGAVCFS